MLAWGNPKANHRGADIATMLAEEAVGATSEPSPVELPVPKAILKQHFQTALETRWNDRWMKAKMAEQSQTFWPCIDLAKSQQVLQWDRMTFTRFVRFFTGHNNLNSHRAKTKETDVLPGGGGVV